MALFFEYNLPDIQRKGQLQAPRPAVGGALPAERTQAAPGQRAMNAQMSVYNYWDMDELVQRLAQHGGFEKAVVNKVSRNGNSIQRSWRS